MLVRVWFDEEMHEMSEELVKEMENRCDRMSGDYCSYVLSIYWDEEYNCPHYYPDGPWEC